MLFLVIYRIGNLFMVNWYVFIMVGNCLFICMSYWVILLLYLCFCLKILFYNMKYIGCFLNLVFMLGFYFFFEYFLSLVLIFKVLIFFLLKMSRKEKIKI